MWVFNKLKEPTKEAFQQIQLYMHFFNIHDGILLYENKNDQNIKCFNVKYDKDVVESILHRLQKIKVSILHNQ